MSKIIDISLPLSSEMPMWPDSEKYSLTQTMSLDNGESANVSLLRMDVHTGTHIDAPRHMLDGGIPVDALPLDRFIGPAFVAYVAGKDYITPRELESAKIPDDTKRLLVRTRNSELWDEGVKEFRENFAAFTKEAARWIVDRGIFTIGIDYLSVQCYRDNNATHTILMEAQVAIIEGLNLSGVEPGRYELICLPMYVVGCDGAPARAVLRTLE